MSNCKFPDSFRVCSLVSARLRQVADEREFSAASVSEAWHQAEVAFEAMFPSLVAAPVAKPKPPVAPKVEVPFEDRTPMPLPASYVRCRHGLYDESLCGYCLGLGAKPFELTDEDEQQEVTELLPAQAPVEAGIDGPELTDEGVPESEQDETSGEIAREGLIEVECE